MSYRNMLTHRCDVYHLEDQESPGGSKFGVPVEDYQKTYDYPVEPNQTDVRCYFHETNQTIVQGDPNRSIVQSYRVHFLPSADVRVNDKVVWDGIELTLQKPRLIRKHHWEVVAVRSDSL